MKREVLFVAGVLALTTQARAVSVSVVIAPQPHAPVKLLACTLQKQYVPLVHGVSVEGLNTGVDFEDLSSKSITQVTFEFTMRDGAGVEIDSHQFVDKGTFSPSAEIKGAHWSEVDGWPTLGEMDCSVSHVIFQDGSFWNVAPEGEASSVP